MHAAKSFGGFEKPSTPKVPFGNHFEEEKPTFKKNLDKSIGAVGQRSPPRPSVRMLRKEKTKPPPLVSKSHFFLHKIVWFSQLGRKLTLGSCRTTIALVLWASCRMTPSQRNMVFNGCVKNADEILQDRHLSTRRRSTPDNSLHTDHSQPTRRQWAGWAPLRTTPSTRSLLLPCRIRTTVQVQSLYRKIKFCSKPSESCLESKLDWRSASASVFFTPSWSSAGYLQLEWTSV